MTDCWKPGDPPPKTIGKKGVRPGSAQAVAAKLAETPGEWVQVKEGLSHGAGSFCASLKDLGCETTTRRDDDKRYGVWARYVGVNATLTLTPPYEVHYVATAPPADAVGAMAKALGADDRLVELRAAIRKAPLAAVGVNRMSGIIDRIPAEVMDGVKRPANLSDLCADKKLWQRVMAWLAEESAA